MTSSPTEQPLSAHERPAPLVRLLGWCNLAVMAGFIANAILTFWFDWPGDGLLIARDGGPAALVYVQLAIYAGVLALAVVYVLGTSGQLLRADAAVVTQANLVFVRAAFWAVFLIKLTDITISFDKDPDPHRQ